MRIILLSLAFVALALPVRADEKSKGIACRSVHLHYPGPAGVAFYNEITPLQSAEGTYFCVCGFHKGYFGIQEKGEGKKVVIFSVWDPGKQNDQKSVPEEDRVKLIDKDSATRIGRFGGEGTGGQSFYDLDWKSNETYKFLVKGRDAGEGRMAFSGWFYHPDAKEWKQMVTFSTKTKAPLQGYYSFVEDFRRNKISATKTRAALFGNAWMQTADGKWQELTKARFTADANPVTNINAKLDGQRFWLGTGGELVNEDTKLNELMTRPASKSTPDVPEGK